VEVSYTTTVDDYVSFSLHMWRKSRVGRGIYLVTWLLPVSGLLGVAAVLTANDLGVQAAGCVIGAVLYAAIYPAEEDYYRVRNFPRAPISGAAN
jgi:hypothetical protein